LLEVVPSVGYLDDAGIIFVQICPKNFALKAAANHVTFAAKTSKALVVVLLLGYCFFITSKDLIPICNFSTFLVFLAFALIRLRNTVQPPPIAKSKKKAFSSKKTHLCMTKFSHFNWLLLLL
jgi:hypothetical protein